MFNEHCTVCLVYNNEHDRCNLCFNVRISGTIIFCSNIHNLGIIATYRCQGCITVTDLYHNVSKIEFPNFILWVTLLNLIIYFLHIYRER